MCMTIASCRDLKHIQMIGSAAECQLCSYVVFLKIKKPFTSVNKVQT